MGIEQTMSIEDNYVKSYHDLWVTDLCFKLFSPFGFKSKFWWSLFMDLIQIVSLVIWTYFNIYTKYRHVSDSARFLFSFCCSISKVAKIVAQSPQQNDHFFLLYADWEISPIC